MLKKEKNKVTEEEYRRNRANAMSRRNPKIK